MSTGWTRRHVPLLLSVGAFAGFGSVAWAQMQAPEALLPQLQQGAKAYADNCASCHGQDLTGGQFAGSLADTAFRNKWAGKSGQDMFEYVRDNMPPGNGRSLTDEVYAALTSVILARNNILPADQLAPGSDLMRQTAFPIDPAGQPDTGGVGGLSDRFPTPEAPARPDRFANYTPVTEAMLQDPAAENWLSWRRSHQGSGFSPLAQIDRNNVDRLTIAWSQALPAGANMNEPLVRDGVLYVFGFGDEVFAFDAEDGHLIWRHTRDLPDDFPPTSKKTMGLYADKLIVATSDLHVIALDARTGELAWDTEITDDPAFRNPGGPLVADGVVMQGLTTQKAGGSLIVGMDAETGEKLWSFNTVAQPGTPGGDTWNGLPADKRHGGSSWTSGTYDAETGLALWGVAQTYDTAPLRDRKPGMNNDGLFTNSTLAFEPRSGKLVWYYQHMKNDQYDLDWTFERVIGTLDVDGAPTRVVMTAGKEGLFDVLELRTGKYIKTVDMGLQDFIASIDPVTGDKAVKPEKVPGKDKGAVFVCPHAGGGRNWTPTSFVQETGLIYVNARDICMDMVPADPGFLTTGVNTEYLAPPGSDGKYGLLQAIDMQTGEVKWEARQRAPFDMGILTTASGLLFTGDMARKFKAYDQASGDVLWQTGVTGVPNGSPISYAVDGKQYIAIVTGAGNPLSFGVPIITPELQLPPVNSSSVVVYSLPE
ncbi:alcohol dehydrogenase (cytochrome c) [Altererythrobacter atlanticus]|uniref:Quinohemoprotein alcohol dehydrogenase ADH IIB n=1 Tax=Croceibacterium atlanticum TaxID=1267766 RepID=A0A0F7KTS8_9SPHN|nr:PQQ-binding-like beta-propeller repeat protein [Croceibacterium atlanticum]AKH42200.1 Quinohemoprotein alcohol dehydrogenase ADH IIB precursor [Croceibacterium atlanticum]MBB5733988.1 alcohol dehydrogenase (cytochrome c) [Croceibacterium atlanticum]